jgi:tetratricopeptide (TPR) repeat protein
MQASYTLFFFGLALVAPEVEFKEAKDRFIRPYLILISGLSLIMIIIHLQHFYIVRKIIIYLRESDVQKSSDGFLRLSEIAGPFLSEEAIMANNYLSSRFDRIKDYQTFLKFYELVKKAYEKDKKDYKTASAYLFLKLTLIDVLKQIGQDPSKEIYEAEKIYNDLISSYPNFSEVYFSYARFLKNIGQEQKAQEILKIGEKTVQNYPKYYLFESALYLDWRKPNIAYEKLKLALAKNFNFSSDNEYEVALRVYLANQDVENSKKIISSWLRFNNSSSTEQKITQILKEYNQSQILKLDKE